WAPCFVPICAVGWSTRSETVVASIRAEWWPLLSAGLHYPRKASRRRSACIPGAPFVTFSPGPQSNRRRRLLPDALPAQNDTNRAETQRKRQTRFSPDRRAPQRNFRPCTGRSPRPPSFAPLLSRRRPASKDWAARLLDKPETVACRLL